MFGDIFSVSHQELQDVATRLAVQHSALLLLLHAKGLISDDDAELFEKCQVQATARLDQFVAQAKEEQRRQLAEEDPEFAKSLEFFEKILGK